MTRDDTPSGWLPRLSQWLAIAGLAGLTGISLAIVADVALRAALNRPLDGLSEVMSLVGALTIASFLPLSMVTRSHVSIRFLNRLVGTRGSQWLERFAALVTLVFVSLVAWQLLVYAKEMFSSGEKTWILQMAIGPWWMGVGALLVLACLAQLGVLIATCRSSAHSTDA
ncbi:TRAP transporter small permease [Hydrogenophaga borbori]|uniref:TRAP transporter small permease n=1 Tax=Hydrogenophaga borbori TaxID=2294117 RepID=UPI00301D7163